MRKKLQLIALALLIAGCIVAIPKWWSAVRESQLSSRIKTELLEEFPEMASEDWNLYMDGSHGIIHGTVSSQAMFSGVDELLSELQSGGNNAISGLDSLKCALTVPHDSSLELSINDETGAINIAGEIPADALTLIQTSLAEAFPTGKISENIKLASGKVAKAPWAEQFRAIAPSLVRCVGNLNIKLQGRAITINGRVASEATRNQIQEQLLNQFAGSIDYVRNGLTTLEGQLETSYLTLEFSETDTIVLGGRIQSRSTRDQLVRGIEAIAPAGFLVENRIKVRPAATGSWWMRPTLAFLPEAFDSLQGSEIRVDASGVAFSGLQMGAEEHAAMTALAKNYFPDEIYAYASQRNPNFIPQTPDPSPIEITRPPLLATAAPEEPQTPLSATPVEIAEEAEPEDNSDLIELIAETQIFFNSGSTRLRETESEKIAILAEKLSNAPETKLDISGLADPTGNASANRRLAQKRCAAVLVALEGSGIDPSRLRIIGGGEKSPQKGEPSWKLRRVEFAITEKLVAVEPDKIGETHIYFEKSSTTLTFEERSKLDRVALTLQEDTPGVLGIAGFTDPNGNRYYNERLSKLRCKAVHDYLVQCGVSDARLKTQPGGELSSSDTNEPSWKKRRVQFQWVELAASR